MEFFAPVNRECRNSSHGLQDKAASWDTKAEHNLTDNIESNFILGAFVGIWPFLCCARQINLLYGGNHETISIFRVKFLKMVSPRFKLRSGP